LPHGLIKGLNKVNPIVCVRRDDRARDASFAVKLNEQLRSRPAYMKTKVQRYGSVVGVKESGVARYQELHAAAWPEVLSIIKRSHIQNYSIYLRKLADGRQYLFSYFEYVGNDFIADMARIAAEPETQRWWAECVPCLELLPDRASGGVWSPMEEVFHLD